MSGTRFSKGISAWIMSKRLSPTGEVSKIEISQPSLLMIEWAYSVKSFRVFHLLTRRSKTSRVVGAGDSGIVRVPSGEHAWPLADIAVSGLGYCSAAVRAWGEIEAG